MIRKALLLLGASILLLAFVEYQVLGYLVSEARVVLRAPSGPTPQQIVERGIAADGTTTLLAVGDIAACDERPGLAKELPNTAALLGFRSSLDPATAKANGTAALAEVWSDMPILALGDTVYRKGRPVEYADCFEPTWGALKSRILPAPGNHEYGTLGAFGYYDYFGAQAGPDRRGWYAARVPGWLILSLNSEADAQPGSAQATWLRDQLAAKGDACVLAFYHRPAHSLRERGGRENAAALFRMVQEGGGTLILNGHNHFYERTAPLDAGGAIARQDGTVGFTVGTGGKTNGPRPVAGPTEAAVFERTGLLKLVLRPGSYSWAFVDTISRELFDEGTAPCRMPRDEPVLGVDR